jgi:uncharacterized protein (DUF983 family)
VPQRRTDGPPRAARAWWRRGVTRDDPLAPFRLTPVAAARLLGRALRLRCPNCGGGRLFQHWLKVRPRCPVCRLRTDRGEGDYFLGAMTVNLLASEAIWALVFVGAIALTWPRVPWGVVQAGGVALMVAAPFALYPFTKTVWLAVDLMFRPVTPDELLS